MTSAQSNLATRVSILVLAMVCAATCRAANITKLEAYVTCQGLEDDEDTFLRAFAFKDETPADADGWSIQRYIAKSSAPEKAFGFPIRSIRIDSREDDWITTRLRTANYQAVAEAIAARFINAVTKIQYWPEVGSDDFVGDTLEVSDGMTLHILVGKRAGGGTLVVCH